MSSDPNEKYRQLVERLIERTRRGVQSWEPAIAENVFFTGLPSGTVEVSRCSTADQEGHPVEWLDLVITNEKGRVADRLSSEPDFSGGDARRFSGPLLAELFRLARANALRSDELVDHLIGELADD